MIRTPSAAPFLALLAACGSAPSPDNGAAASPANLADVAATANAVEDLPPPASVNPALYLPQPGSYRARAMVLAVPGEMQALAARISAGLRANQAWFREYARRSPPGELPWHPNLGVSEAEYRRFLALSRQLALREAAQVTFTVTRRPDGGLALAATGPASALNGIVVHPARDRAETPLGTLASRSAIDNRERSSPTGPWRGVQWSNRGQTQGYPVKLAFGRRAAGDLILYHDYGPSDSETIVLLYQAPVAASGAR